ncbi:hypothetical protein [Methylobacterium sp. 37f]|uniref:hypothetical protein n=1 Tax=Methylobacterium sp. 37f TaxID=2817058 RepID=UPI001FFD97A2|nr:hypothetical protein [Methylobacterium sp. 37f]
MRVAHHAGSRQMAKGVMSADIHTIPMRGGKTGTDAAPAAAHASDRAVAQLRPATPPTGTAMSRTLQQARRRLTIVTEQTHPEAFARHSLSQDTRSLETSSNEASPYDADMDDLDMDEADMGMTSDDDARSDAPGRDDASATFTGREDAPQALRRRGPLVTRWIGFSAQRRRARERTNRLQHHDTGAARSGS